MKIINAGLGRTGTTSLKAALNKLGFSPVFHSTEMITNPKDIDIWEGALQGKEVDWRSYFDKYQVLDWPAGLFYRDIINAHPDAKVLLTVRDPEEWAASMQGMLRQLMSFNLPIPHLRRVKRFMQASILDGLFEGKIEDTEFMVQFFHKHVDEVKAFVPADRLLIYQASDGWEPLCAFLGMDVPDEPYPSLNRQEGFQGLLRRLFIGKS